MMEQPEEGVLGTAIATPHDRRRAFLVMAVAVAAFAITAPFAQRITGAIPQFAPLYDTAILVLDTLAAVLLYAQFEQVRRRSMLVLACAYVFTPWVVAAHALSIPNAYVPGILIGGEQSAAWLWVIWHAVFPVFIGAYAFCARDERAEAAVADTALRSTGTMAVMSTVGLALAAVALTTLGDAVMPALMRGDTQSSPVTTLVLSLTCLLHMAALAALFRYTRLRRVIDLWLAVTLVALTIDVLLSGALIVNRSQLGYYLGRVYGLLAVLLVLGVLLRETVRVSAIAARSAAELHSADRAKDRFLAILGHELRNPLSAIVMALQVMRRKGIDSREFGVVERQAAHLAHLVEDLLDVSRIGTGKIVLAKRPLELSEAVLRGAEIAAPALADKRQNLEINVASSGLLLEGDPDRLAQVFGNLLTNASKFSGGGTRIRVDAEKKGDRVSVSVKDEGIGIPPQMLERIFEAFTQESQPDARTPGGLGLGLTIVRSLVEQHGGRVTVRSEGRDRGSEFIVELPLARPG
ncbi:MAG TPA: ATP-binding protein [Burkholderiales bacterium]|jgi:signal transduction histidine kinase|nr:ATP-binding protein [Burkholderiales bacterium]